MDALLSTKQTICDVADQIQGKRVVMRVDFNVPIIDGKVTDTTRIVQTLPTIEYVLKHGASSLVLMSHCGRPDGRKQEKYTLEPVVEVLKAKLGRSVQFIKDYFESDVSVLPTPSVCLLENLRFHVEEEGKGKDASGQSVKADPNKVVAFGKALASMGDIFINDAFGTAHRAHCSMVQIQLPIRAAGLLMKKELDYFHKALSSPARPFLSILGGAKVHDKIQLIKSLLQRVDMMIIGGGMAYTFKKVIDNMPIGNSLYDSASESVVVEIMKMAKEKNVKILLPRDFVCADNFSNDANIKIFDAESGIPDGWMGMDCGEKSRANALEMIKEAKTIIWNGPQGVFEMPNFAKGSLAFLEGVVEATKNGVITIVGGGDTASLVENAGKGSEVSHVSTGGGASLELLEGKILPGVKALSDKA